MNDLRSYHITDDILEHRICSTNLDYIITIKVLIFVLDVKFNDL